MQLEQLDLPGTTSTSGRSMASGIVSTQSRR